MSKCVSPIMIKNPKYHLQKLMDNNSTMYMLVPCGKCIGCLKAISDEWNTRLTLEIGDWDSCYFVTLTYNDDQLPPDGVSKRHIQLFHKRLRKAGYNFKYYLISEYGSHTLRPHYHGIYYGLPDYVFEDFWHYGFSLVKPVSPESIRYVTGYHILKNDFLRPDCNPNFKLCSRGLGYHQFEVKELDNAMNNHWRFIVDYDGNYHSIPRYIRKKYGITFPSASFDYDTNSAKNWSSREAVTKQYKKRKFQNKQI